MAQNLVGKVSQVLGAVIDVHFDGDLPPIRYNRTRPEAIVQTGNLIARPARD